MATAPRQTLAGVLQAEVSADIDAHAEAVDEMVTGWWSATIVTTNAS
jgi:hypothetical protein